MVFKTDCLRKDVKLALLPPPKYKLNVANNFIHRVSALSPNWNQATTKTVIIQQLTKNNYPRTLINRLISLYNSRNNSRQHQRTTIAETPSAPSVSELEEVRPSLGPGNPASSIEPNEVEESNSAQLQIASDHHQIEDISNIDEQQQKSYRSIPYVHGLSERIINILAHDYADITITCRQYSTVKSFHTRVKDPVNKTEQSNIIYRIQCKDCPQSYVGMTQNKLKTRLYGHKTHINKLEHLLESGHTNTDTEMIALREKTALIEHCIDHNHRFDLDNTQVIDRSDKTHNLPFLEMCHITNTPNTVNHRTDVCSLSTTYAAILHTIGEKLHRR
ncbi:uncharacterized protein LOC134285233 isoform X1 [Aedes albopictus]|uniref:GIY-YIG domain-containing protein n=1 Tax=Aedes albopictus TaxID=7160 RepID=A0ABM1ZQ81_AEDAL